MRKLRFGLIVCASIIIIGQLSLTDYSDLSWSNNLGRYLGIIAMLGLILSMILSGLDEKRKCK
tara:strand:- start:9166 stop:9354 length:189 start_codon:yes stop_codon:yes gene_type:complete